MNSWWRLQPADNVHNLNPRPQLVLKRLHHRFLCTPPSPHPHPHCLHPWLLHTPLSGDNGQTPANHVDVKSTIPRVRLFYDSAGFALRHVYGCRGNCLCLSAHAALSCERSATGIGKLHVRERARGMGGGGGEGGAGESWSWLSWQQGNAPWDGVFPR